MASPRTTLICFIVLIVVAVTWRSTSNVDTVMDQYQDASVRKVNKKFQPAAQRGEDGATTLRAPGNAVQTSSSPAGSSTSQGSGSRDLGVQSSPRDAESSTVESASNSVAMQSSSQPNVIEFRSSSDNIDGSSMRNVSVGSVSTEKFTQLMNNMDQMLSKMRFTSDHIFPMDFKVSYLADYKTPCYMEGTTRSCLPYFFIGGFPKCGTTELFAKLVKHPQILKGRRKEPHWWTRFRYINNKSFKSYRDFFKKTVPAIWNTVDENGHHPLILTEGSASTVWDNSQLFSQHVFHTPPHLNIHAIHAVLPDARFVLILRHPVTRLYSDYLYFQKKYSPENFHSQVVKSIRIFHECLHHAEKTFLYCLYAPSPPRSPPLYHRLRVALYYVHLKVVLSVYPRSNLFVLQLENYMQDEVTWLRKIMNFLDVSLMSVKDIEEIIQKRKAANSNKKGYKKSGPMLNETKILLEDFYKPYNIQLKKLLGDGYLEY